jgi:hypothetical protein
MPTFMSIFLFYMEAANVIMKLTFVEILHEMGKQPGQGPSSTEWRGGALTDGVLEALIQVLNAISSL